MSDDKQQIYLIDMVSGWLVRTTLSYAIMFGFIYLGVLLDSAALQWLGAVFAFLGITGMTLAYTKSQIRTPQEAADYIAKVYNVRAK